MGSTAAAAKLLGLKGDKLRAALALGASQAGGLQQNFGTMTKPFHPGRAAQSGVLATMLARRGFTATTISLEGERGFAKAFSSNPDLSRVTADLGERWELHHNGLKLYSCGVSNYPLIDAAIALHSQSHVQPDMVESITARVHPTVMEKANHRQV